jgi:hypothetical protein
MFNSQFFLAIVYEKKRRSDNVRQINNTHNLKKRETNAKSNIDFDFNILLINKRQMFVFVSTIFVTFEKDSSTTIFAS